MSSPALIVLHASTYVLCERNESIKWNMLYVVISDFGCEEGEKTSIERARCRINGEMKPLTAICSRKLTEQSASMITTWSTFTLLFCGSSKGVHGFSAWLQPASSFFHDLCENALSLYFMSYEAPMRFMSRAVEKASDIIAMCTALRFLQTLYTRDYRKKIHNAKGIMHTPAHPWARNETLTE